MSCTLSSVQLANLLRACSDASEGRRLDALIQSSSYRQNRFLANLLVEMYGSCSCIDDARRVFDRIADPNIFSWNIMLTAYAREGSVAQAEEIFDRMPERSAVSWNALLAAYSLKGHADKGRRLFEMMPGKNVVSWTTMLKLYARSGNVDQARLMFDRMPHRDVVAWTVLVEAYAENGQLQEAWEMYCRMPQRDVVVSTTMIRVRALDGNLTDARRVFDRLPEKNIVTWTAMIEACSRKSSSCCSIELFRRMDLEGLFPDEICFTGVLTACKNLGLVDEARLFLSSMQERGMKPAAQHYCCLIELLSKIGHLTRADELLKVMPFSPDSLAWTSLLDASCVQSDLQHLPHAAKHIFHLDSQNAVPYVLLSSHVR